jgi:radical SAM protein with 4Fe4S-binding SPASM domain
VGSATATIRNNMSYLALGKDVRIEDATVPVISPNWRLKQSGDWFVLSKYQAEEMTYTVISPLMGATLPLLNGKMSIRHLAMVLQYAHDLDNLQTAKNILISIINKVNEKSDAIVEMRGDMAPYIKEYDALKFIQSPSDLAIQKRLAYPLSLTVMFSNACETNCVYCYASRRHVPLSEQLSTKRWIEIFYEAHTLGIELISLSGGDPLFRKDAITLIRELIKLKMLFLLSTKCHINREKAERLVEIGMTEPVNQYTREIQISMDGPDENTADFLAGSPGYFNRAVDSIKNLRERNFNFRVKAVLMPFNAPRVYDWIKLMVDLGANKLSVAAYNRTFFRHRDNLFLSREDRDLIGEQCNRARADFPGLELRISGLSSALTQKEQEIASKTDMDMMSVRTGNPVSSDKMEKWKNRTHCSGGRSSIVVTPDGKVVLCDTVPQADMFIVGDLSTQSIMEVWNSEKLLDFAFPSHDKFIGTLCYGCAWLNDCLNSPAGYCFRNSYFNYGTIFGPPPECPIIPDNGLRYE